MFFWLHAMWLRAPPHRCEGGLARPASFRLGVVYNDSFDDWAALSEGAYLLRSNICDWSDEQLWKAYIQLTQAEAAFRIQKDQLNLRPIWHQREDRVQAHILVCFLAFVLWKSLEMWQSRAGLGNSPRTVLEELARIQSNDVVLPTASHGQIRLRCVTQYARGCGRGAQDDRKGGQGGNERGWWRRVWHRRRRLRQRSSVSRGLQRAQHPDTAFAGVAGGSVPRRSSLMSWRTGDSRRWNSARGNC